MSFPQHSGTSATPKSTARATKEFELSNLTTARFLGGTQKTWMTGHHGTLPQSPVAAREPSNSAVNVSSTVSQPSETLPGIEEAAQAFSVWSDQDSAVPVFGSHFDRGRFPAQRRRRGGTKNYSARSSVSIAPSSALQQPSSPATPNGMQSAPGVSKSVSASTDNVLPSPSPSDEVRHDSANIVDTEEESQGGPRPAPKFSTRLEELVAEYGGIDQLEKTFENSGSPNYNQDQITAIPNPGVTIESTVAHSPSVMAPGLPFGSKNKSTSASCTVDLSIATPSKRASEDAGEPRKHIHKPSGQLSSGPNRLTSRQSDVRNKNTHQTPQSTAAGELYNSARTATWRLESVQNVPGRRLDVEMPRLGLLREACDQADYFFLILHQLFCSDHLFGNSKQNILELTETHKRGLGILTDLLVSNDKLSDDAIAWFTIFPLPLETLLRDKPILIPTYHDVLKCLSCFANNWQATRSSCEVRHYPTLVDELLVLFNAKSFILQQVICRAILRDIWALPQDQCFSNAEEVFRKDYHEVELRLALKISPPTDVLQAYSQSVLREYLTIYTHHSRHTQRVASGSGHTATTNATIAPPHQTQNQPVLTNRSRSGSYFPGAVQSPPLSIDVHAAQQVPIANGGATSTPVSVERGLQYTLANVGHPSGRHDSSNLNGYATPVSAFPNGSPAAFPGFQNPSTTTDRLQSQVHGRQEQSNEFIGAGSPASASPETRWTWVHSGAPNSQAAQFLPSYAPEGIRPYRPQQNQGAAQSQAPLIFQSPGHYLAAPPRNPNHMPPPERPRSQLHNASGEPTATMTARQFIRLPDKPLHPTQPNPSMSALHQAHVRSPILSSVDSEGKVVTQMKNYSFIKQIILPPDVLSNRKRHVVWDFSIHQDLIERLARDVAGPCGSPPLRTVGPGSRLCRIRCINANGSIKSMSQSQWVAEDNVWPSNTAIIFNGIALEIRRKSHHGKDLPIDVTRYVKAGANNLTAAAIGFPKDSNADYAIGLEIVQIFDDKQIIDSIPTIPWQESRKSIIDRLSTNDPDVQVVNPQIVLDLTDPFTSCIFEIPIRGSSCRHDQCFDLHIFLQTRNRKTPTEPCEPDEFRCPVCGADARPQSLVIDGFYAQVRDELKKQGRLDAKAIILHNLGDWEIKEEEEVSGESGDGVGRRSMPQQTAVPGRSTHAEVIEIDDD